MDNKEFKAIRLKLGLTQPALAKRIGASLQQVKRWEANPQAAMHRKISPMLANLMRMLEKP